MKDDNGMVIYENPNKIWCPYCLADWDLLPGEYESMIDRGIIPSCPLCGNDGMEFITTWES